MVTLEEIRKTFPRAGYAPDPNCKKCGGKGMYDMAPEKAAKTKYLRTTGLPCMCIFVGDPELRQIAAETLAEVARKGLDEI